MKRKTILKSLTGFILFFLLVALDQLTKYIATLHLKNQAPFVIIDNVLELNYLDGGNTGAAWGILSGKISFFILSTIVVCFLICLFLCKLELEIRKNKNIGKKIVLLQLLLVVLISGAVGNLIDRICNGYVIDFIYFKLINFPVFNVADCYVTISAFFILIICIFFMSDDDFAEIFSLKNK